MHLDKKREREADPLPPLRLGLISNSQDANQMQSKQDARQIGGPSKRDAWQTVGNGRRRRLLAFYGAISKRTF